MSINDFINFALPIGWNEFGVIATAIAVVVALRANKKATEQLQSALAMQEQSKNVSLFDRRVNLAEKIRSEQPVSELELQILFNEEILKHYRAWRTYIKRKISAEYDMEHFFSLWQEACLDDSVKRTIEKYEFDLLNSDNPPQLCREYENYCNEHLISSEIEEDGTYTSYDYLEIRSRHAQAGEEAKKENELTVQLIKDFIGNSIKKVS